MMHDWFKKAKLGIFIHWGIYAVKGVPESWSMAIGQMSCDDYYKMIDGFTADAYDPDEWAHYFKAAGANYAVLTTKHHDGFALYDTPLNDLNIMRSPCKRDLVAPYCEAMRKAGIKPGLYFTHTDWADDDHMRVVLNMKQDELDEMRKKAVSFRDKWCYSPPDDESKAELDECWSRFMSRYKAQITELLERYDPDLFWFDYMLTRNGFSWESADVKQMVEKISPKTICNGKLANLGDYIVAEMYIPLMPFGTEWEFGTTFNNSWGYRPDDHAYKDVRQIVRMLCECISKGGNMLISSGPDARGRIPEEVKRLMLELGEWTHKYAEAIYPTEQGIATEYYLGGSTLSEDKKTLYLFSYDRCNKHLMLNGIRNRIKKVTALKNGAELNHSVTGGAPWANIPGCIWIDVPDEAIDDVCSVFKVEFDEPIDLTQLGQRAYYSGDH